MVEENLVACANILPQIASVFRWEGIVTEAEEAGVLFKTSGELLDRAVGRLAQLHPYDTPAVLGWRTDTAARQTSEWLWASVRPEAGQ